MNKSLVATLLVACSAPAARAPAPVQAPTPPAAVPAAVPAPPMTAQPEDPYLWLEDITGEKSLAWARAQSDKSAKELQAFPAFGAMRDRALAILDSKEKLPFVTKRGAYYYNFWRDAANPKGLSRRTTLAEYKKPNPKWETVLDIDALAKAENENWVYSGMTCLYPKYERCLVDMSRGGGDTTVVREFDLVKKQFVADGFVLPAAKSTVAWKDENTVYVATDFGEGTMTSSGYPRIVKEWKRGTPLSAATTIYEGQTSDVSVGAARIWDHGKAIDLVHRDPSFFTNELFVRGDDGKLTKLDLPLDASAGVWNAQLLVTLRSDWTLGAKTWPKGALLATPLADFLAGKREMTMLFTPTAKSSLDQMVGLKSGLILNELQDVKNHLYVWKLAAGKWQRADLPSSGATSVSVNEVDANAVSDDYWLTATDYVTPTTLSLGALGKKPVALKQMPKFFDAKGLKIEQHFATSKDGTKVPYFQVARDTLKLDGSNPTVMMGYGGFEVSMTPNYNSLVGALWLERGGVYIVANIRGGGEYGPAWHQAALRHDRQRAYDDFIAIAEDLAARKVTSPAHLGIVGGSNGGLLMGVMLTERPDLFGAIVAAVPLLDMKRYHKLLAGASWMEEYGDPDNSEDWAALSKFSPYQNVKKGVKYPRTLFTTSTHDDRVHPGHARKMAARMLEQGHDVLYYERTEGGHGGAATNEQTAFMEALEFSFFAKQLGLTN